MALLTQWSISLGDISYFLLLRVWYILFMVKYILIINYLFFLHAELFIRSQDIEVDILYLNYKYLPYFP